MQLRPGDEGVRGAGLGSYWAPVSLGAAAGAGWEGLGLCLFPDTPGGCQPAFKGVSCAFTGRAQTREGPLPSPGTEQGWVGVLGAAWAEPALGCNSGRDQQGGQQVGTEGGSVSRR